MLPLNADRSCAVIVRAFPSPQASTKKEGCAIKRGESRTNIDHCMIFLLIGLPVYRRGANVTTANLCSVLSDRVAPDALEQCQRLAESGPAAGWGAAKPSVRLAKADQAAELRGAWQLVTARQNESDDQAGGQNSDHDGQQHERPPAPAGSGFHRIRARAV